MTAENTELDRLLDELNNEASSMPQHRGIKWGELSDVQFELKKAEVFADMRAMGKQKRLAAGVRELDEEAEAARRRKAEPRDVNVTFSNSG